VRRLAHYESAGDEEDGEEGRVNANDLAKLITQREGKRLSLSIAQVKEVMRVMADLFSESEEVRVALIRYLLTDRKEQKRIARKTTAHYPKPKKIETSIVKRLKK
jgi:hypothetical protein